MIRALYHNNRPCQTHFPPGIGSRLIKCFIVDDSTNDVCKSDFLRKASQKHYNEDDGNKIYLLEFTVVFKQVANYPKLMIF